MVSRSDGTSWASKAGILPIWLSRRLKVDYWIAIVLGPKEDIPMEMEWEAKEEGLRDIGDPSIDELDVDEDSEVSLESPRRGQGTLAAAA